MRKSLLFLLTATALGGCAAGSESWVNAQMGSGGNIAIDEVDATKGLYRVSVINVVDFGWDGDDPQDRLQAAKVAMGKICQDATLISETKIPMGRHLSRERNKYAITMRCPEARA